MMQYSQDPKVLRPQQLHKDEAKTELCHRDAMRPSTGGGQPSSQNHPGVPDTLFQPVFWFPVYH